MQSFIVSTDRPPNAMLYSIWKLETILIPNRDKITLAEEEKTEFSIEESLCEVFAKKIGCFEGFSMANYKYDFPKYRISRQLTEFCFYLINNLNHSGFQEVFAALGMLISAEGKLVEPSHEEPTDLKASLEEVEAKQKVFKHYSAFIQQILPSLVYYVLRWNNDEEVIHTIRDTLTEILKHGTYNHRMIVFSVHDFIRICFVQDRKCFEKFIRSSTTYACKEVLYTIPLVYPPGDPQQANTDQFMKQIGKVKDTYMAVRKMKQLLNDIDLNLMFKAARSARELKRAIIYCEENIRRTILKKDNESLTIRKDLLSAGHTVPDNILDIIDYNEQKELVELYCKVYPEDYKLSNFSMVQSQDMEVDSQLTSRSATPMKSPLRQNPFMKAIQQEVVQDVFTLQDWDLADNAANISSNDFLQLKCFDSSNHKALQAKLKKIIREFDPEDLGFEEGFKDLIEYFAKVDVSTIDLSTL